MTPVEFFAWLGSLFAGFNDAINGALLWILEAVRHVDPVVRTLLAGLGIPILARDVGGDTGRRLTLDTASGIVSIRIPGGGDFSI